MYYQDLHGWRLNGDIDGVQVSLFNPFHPLDIHIKDANEVLSSYIFHSSLTEHKNENRERFMTTEGKEVLIVSKWVLNVHSYSFALYKGNNQGKRIAALIQAAQTQ